MIEYGHISEDGESNHCCSSKTIVYMMCVTSKYITDEGALA